MASCVAAQFASRDSNGCVELCESIEGMSEERRVSWRPGAEGAPRSVDSVF